ncbi:hypothetical protein MesoLjLc_51760 [Mesorhizobium sp. L-8-10]|uniref:ATP-binding protein n=1 Tax=Mesorhizobium sp. L-8-10 TaxID=2744523 RepID=UPI0019294054|nr:ATP-binding protein [Mesorhizobium sp. L-8-10]BCH33246.1 hypothetical protein MesoLjLc_51760 [Mesorhizobium sp. L-8-10]
MSQKTYKIVRLESENVKRLKAVAIEPSGNVVEITGENGAGKTSLLDSIFWALSGKEHIQANPIRQGEEKARVTLNLGSLTVTRRMTRQEDGSFTTTLVVENDEGMRAQSPQKMLDAIVGELSFDPLAFTRMDPKKQFDQLKQFVAGYDFDAAAKRRKEFFDQRTDVNRRTKDLTAQADGVIVPEDTPDNPVDESSLVADLEQAGAHNVSIETRKRNREALQNDIGRRETMVTNTLAKIESLRTEIARLEEAVAADREWIKEQQDRLAEAGPLPEPIDTAAVRATIDEARRVNALVARKRQRMDLEAKAAESAREAKKLTVQIELIDEEKAKAIAAAKMPVDGIGFGDDMVLLNGFPFDQASTAEQLRASIALTMAANPRLRILLVRDGSLLDKNSMKLLAEMAESHQFQVWVESVGQEDRPGAIIIEDGMVRGQIAEAAE